MLRALARRRSAVVARGAIASDAGVIESRALKADSVLVTSLTRRCRRHVSWRFALRVRSVVTANAGAGRLLVVVARLIPALN